MSIMSYLGAIGAAQREALAADERVILIGEDVEANVYGTTGGTGTGHWSEHAYGEAVDINPVENPYVGCGMTRSAASRPSSKPSK